MFGEVLKRIRTERKLNMDQFVKSINDKYDTKISKSMVSRWENGITDPKMEYVRIIADFFDITLDELLELDQEQVAPTWATNKDKRDFKEMLMSEGELMFDGVPLTDDDKEKLRRVMEAMFWDAKKMNKRNPIDGE